MQGKAPKPKKQGKPAPLVPDNSDSEVELDEEDHDIFQEFGERVDFLGSLSAEGLSQPTQEAAKRKAPPQARCRVPACSDTYSACSSPPSAFEFGAIAIALQAHGQAHRCSCA